MTLQDIENMSAEFLTADDIAKHLGVDPHRLRLQAETDPDKLGFATVRYGHKTLFPRRAYIYFQKYGRPVAT